MIYFDNSATTLNKPQCVIDAVVSAMNSMGNCGRGVNFGSLSSARLVYETRKLLSDFLGGYGPEYTVFTSNSTESLNIAINGIANKGDHFLTTFTEHNSVLRPLYKLRDEGMISMDIVPKVKDLCKTESGFVDRALIDYNSIKNLIRPNTKAIVVNHVSNVTGNVANLELISKVAKEYNLLLIVDASQSAGVFPIDMKKMGIDILAVTGHKGLLGPQGIGALLIKDDILLKRFKVGGSGVQTYNEEHPEQMPTRLEAGTLNSHGIAGLKAGIEFLLEEGIEKIHIKETSLMTRFINGIKDIPGIKIYGDFGINSETNISNIEFKEEDLKNRGAVVSLLIDGYDSGEISDILSMDQDIATRSGGHCAPLVHKALGTMESGLTRFSFGYFNTFEEIDIALKALHTL